MTGMIAWGTMVAVISSGARIAAERSVGWTRQLRITPLPTWSYFAAKIFCGYMMALLSMACSSGPVLSSVCASMPPSGSS
jgi:ABC-2 type transport system permease protein